MREVYAPQPGEETRAFGLLAINELTVAGYRAFVSNDLERLMDPAFSAAFSDDPSKVEQISRAAQEARESTDDKPEPVEAEDPAAPSVAKVDETPPVTEEAPEPQKTRDDQGKFVKTVPHEALHAERKRREGLEAELAQLREAQKKPPTSVLEDEDLAFKERLDPAIARERERFFNYTKKQARSKPGREDYDEVYAFMEEEVKTHPALYAQIDQDDPGESIYLLGKTRKELSEVGGDLTKYRDHVTQGERLKLQTANERIKALEAELNQAKASQKQREAIPQSLNSEQSASQRDEVFKGPTPMRDVLPKI